MVVVPPGLPYDPAGTTARQQHRLLGPQPMNVILIEPAFPSYQRHFARALKTIGANVTAVGERPIDHLDGELQGWLTRYFQVRSVTDEQELLNVVRHVQSFEWVDRLEATIEAHVLPAARVREATGIPGTSVRTAYLCRDKPVMKDALRAAGIPVAQSIGTDDPKEVRAFAAAVGLPIVIKPRDAAGASGTFKASSQDELERALHDSGVARRAPVAVEEWVEGHEGFIDTLTVGGHIHHSFVTHYFPNVLEAMRTRWISPQMVATNAVEADVYDEVRRVAAAVNAALGINTTATHMEWFFGPKGLKVSEIGCRPPGVNHWDLYNDANEMDIYRDWALAVTHGRTEQRPSRRYACGLVALRPDRDGVISGYEGADRVFSDLGDQITASHFPALGTPTQGVAAGFMANAWMRVRMPDFDDLRRTLNWIGETIQIHAK